MKLAPRMHLGDAAEIDAALVGLVAQNLEQRKRGLVPSLGQAKHVRYVREPIGRENWQSAVETFRLGSGDCEDLASWLCADLQFLGIPAKAITIRTGENLRHCVVDVNGRRFDPSKARGMRGAG